MATGNGNVEMMVSVLPGTMTGFAALNAGLASINNSFLLMTSAISENFGLVDTAILTTGVVVAQFAADAMSAFADFEQSMKIVQLVSGQTADQIQYLGQKANEFAVQYRTDIDSITEGLQTLGRAGLNTATEQTEVLQNGLSTSKLEGRELNSVLQELIQNTALLGGDLKSDQFGEQSQYVNDLLVATSLSAPINTHDISETLKYSGGIAAAAGANIESDEGKRILEDYMGAIAAFAQKGVTGSIAGTALRAFFNKPATQDSSVVEALSSIGLSPESLWEDGGDRMKPVSEQIAIIKGQMDKLNVSTMDQLQIWSKIVGGKMGQQMMKLESDDIKTLTSDIREAESAESLANESMNTFKMNINEIGQEGQRAFRNYGSTLVWVFNPVVEILKQIVHLFNNPILTSALAVGTLGFFRAFISRARQVIGGFTQGLRNVWNDYAGDNRLSISQYRGEQQKTGNKLTMIGRDTNGNPVFGSQSESPKQTKTTTKTTSSHPVGTGLYKSEKDFMTQWQKNSTSQAWADFQKGKLTADQFGFIKKTSRWSEASEIEGMVRRGMIPQHMYDDIRAGMNKKTFIGKYGEKGNGEFVALQQRYQEALKKSNQTVSNSTNVHEKYANSVAKQSATREKVNQAVINNQTTIERKKQLAQEEANLAAEKNATAQKNVANSENSACVAAEAFNQKLRTMTAQMRMPGSYRAPGWKPTETSMTSFTSGKVYSTNNGVLVGGVAAAANKAANDLYRNIAGPLDKNTFPYTKSSFGSLLNDINKKTTSPVQGPSITLDDILKQNSKKVIKTTPDVPLLPPAKAPYAGGVAPGSAMAHMNKIQLTEAQIAAEELKRLALVEEELMIERQIHDKRVSRESREDVRRNEMDKYNRQAYGYNNPKAKEQFNAKMETQRYLNANAKANAAIGKNAQEMDKSIKALNNELKSPTKHALNSALAKYGSADQYQAEMSKQGLNQIVKDNQALINRTVQQPPMGVNIMPTSTPVLSNRERFSQSLNQASQSVRNFGKTMRTNFMSYIDRDRTGRMLGFANKGLGKWTNRLLNATDVMGGPFMVAMMGVMLVMQKIQEWHQEHVKKMQELGQKVDDAYDKIDAAESGLKKAYSDEYPDMDKKELEQVTLDVYSQMNEDMVNAINNGMDNWIEKMAPDSVSLPEYEENEEGDLQEKEQPEQDFTTAVNENTKALYQAIFELQQASSKYVTEATDDYWGTDGYFSVVTDSYGKLTDVMTHASTMGSAFEDNNEFLLTASQKADDYDGNTELVGLLLEDFKDTNGEWVSGLRRLMGKNVDELAAVIQPSSRAYLQQQAQFAYGIGAANNARLQLSMQKDKKSWQALAKEIAKEERKTGKALDKSASAKSGNKRLEGLVAKLNASMGNNFSRTQILQAAYLQQLQDMYQVAQQVFTPLFQQAAQATTATWQTSLGINSATQNTVNTTGGTMDNVSIVAGLVAIIARSTAKTAFHDAYVNMDPNAPNVSASDKHLHELAMTNDSEGFYKAVMEEANSGQVQGGWLNNGAVSKVLSFVGLGKYVPQIGVDGAIDARYGAFQYGAFAESIAKQISYGYSPADAWEKAQKDAEQYKNENRSIQDYLIDIDKNYQNPAFLEKIENAYEASGVGEPDDSGSGGGGGSGGGDSGDKDKGTKKERVDLVLCNKKEIPKLNVNLFKKPPSFTVLNKNFKLRDIKVNTQDKPKAVLSSIKNAIIDVQKRSDPKIIQDESAEYDPVSATEGSSVPSGSTNTGTD